MNEEAARTQAGVPGGESGHRGCSGLPAFRPHAQEEPRTQGRAATNKQLMDPPWRGAARKTVEKELGPGRGSSPENELPLESSSRDSESKLALFAW